MANLSFTCNSFKFVYWLKFWGYFFFKGRKKIRTNFGNALAKYFDTRPEHVFLFGAGRMGLFTLLKSLKLQENDEVIVCGYTCVVVTNAVKYAGAKVIYADINPETLNFDVGNLKNKISGNTKAIIVPHNFGIVFEDINTIKSQFPQIIIIEDAAHSFGSVDSNGIKTGRLGDASFFSFEFSKPITTGMGGVLIINNESLIQPFIELYKDIPEMKKMTVFKIILSLKLHYFTSLKAFLWTRRYVFALFHKLKLVYLTPPEELSGLLPKEYPVKLSPLLSAFGLFQVNDIKHINSVKIKISEDYSNILGRMNGIKTFQNKNYVLVRYPILFQEFVPISVISQIKQELMDQKIYFGDWFNDVVHPKGSFRYCYNTGNCVIGEQISERIINLPINISSQLTNQDIRRIAEILNKHLNGIKC